MIMKEIKYKNIPNCLRKYRKIRGLNQSEVAKILGLKREDKTYELMINNRYKREAEWHFFEGFLGGTIFLP